jgi:selenide,water dikinase
MADAAAEAATDVTGFGLLGHLQEMLLASGVAAELDAGAVPLLPGALELARAGWISGGTRRNLEFVDGAVRWTEPPTDEERLLLADAQTSGGLLIAASDGARLDAALRARGISAARVAVIRNGRAGTIDVAGRVAGG